MKETVYAKKIYGEHKELWYYLLREDESGLYGVAVASREGDSWDREEAMFTYEASDALFLLESFSKGLVTPITLLCLLDDWQSEG